MTDALASQPPGAVPERPLPLTAVDQCFAEADVVIVGGGGAGTSAAIEAATAGASVLLLEAASATGGSTAMAGGLIYLGGGTPTQRACGFEDSLDAMYEYLRLASGPNADLDKVRLYCDHSLEHYAWLLAQGVEFKPSWYPKKHTNTPNEDGLIYTGNEQAWPYCLAARPAPRGHKPLIAGDHGGIPLMQKLSAAAARLGVRTICDARARSCIVDGERVVGVTARIDGKVGAIMARRGVVLTAGGFIMNNDMVKTYAPRLTLGNYLNGNPNDTGEGIRMGMAVGGEAINMHEGFVSLPFYPPSRFVEAIAVDDKGQRFINEDVYHGRMGAAIFDRPERKYYLVIDSQYFDILHKPPMGGFPVAAVGETAAELEQELGLVRGTLAHTLEIYNRHARTGEDPLFHKHPDYLVPLDQPPYAAFDISLHGGAYFAVFTLGGLNTLPTGEVLRPGRLPIPGLFAAGRTTAGLPRCGEGYSSGMSIGDATFFGRLAGRTAAASPPWCRGGCVTD